MFTTFDYICLFTYLCLSLTAAIAARHAVKHDPKFIRGEFIPMDQCPTWFLMAVVFVTWLPILVWEGVIRAMDDEPEDQPAERHNTESYDEMVRESLQASEQIEKDLMKPATDAEILKMLEEHQSKVASHV
jgi:hypothetical protein